MKIYHKITNKLIIEVENIKTDLSCANLSYADLSYADLSYADLSCANLSCADLRYANLRYANLSDAKFDKEILFYQFNQHVLQKIDNEIRIGCEVHSTDHWLKKGKKIGKKADYSKEEIEKYMNFIKLIGEKANESSCVM